MAFRSSRAHCRPDNLVLQRSVRDGDGVEHRGVEQAGVVATARPASMQALAFVTTCVVPTTCQALADGVERIGGPQMSEPACVAEPGVPTGPTSVDCHGGGRGYPSPP
jgi:hypothetical protein